MKGRISVTGTRNANRRSKNLTFKNNAPFRSCISKINNTLMDNAEDLDIVIPMYNLLEYSNNFSMTSRSLWKYYRDEVNDSADEIDDNDNMINKKKQQQVNIAEVVVPLKYLSNFWRSLDLPLVNCEIELDLTWSKYCVTSQVSIKFRVVDQNADSVEYEAVTATTGTKFQIKMLNFMFQLSLCL